MTAIGAPTAGTTPLGRGVAGIPLLVVAVLLLSTAVDVLPGDSIVGVGQFQLNLARILVVLGFAALALTGGLRAERLRSRRAFAVALPLALLAIAGLLASHKWGTYPRYRFLLEGIGVFFLTYAVAAARADARASLATVGLVALAIVALTAVAQVAQGEPTGFYRHGCTPVTQPFGHAPPGTVTRAIGTFANPNVLAGYLMLMLPLGGLGGAALLRVRGAWPLLVATLGFGYLAVILTYSRAAVLLSIAVIGVGLALSRATHRRLLIPVALALAIAVSFLAGSCGSDATAGYGRSQEWRQTLSVIHHNPVYGVGLGRLGQVLHRRNAASSARHAHNLFLTWWAEAGTGALIAWIWLAAVLLWRSLRGARGRDPTSRAAFVALVGFFGYSMVDHPANVDRVALAFWIAAGLAAASGRRLDVTEEETGGGETLFVPSAQAGNVRVIRRAREQSSSLDF
ncbi:MAG: hypothetical protein NVS2B6_08060 [Thermoleophilaceae bacterium]